MVWPSFLDRIDGIQVLKDLSLVEVLIKESGDVAKGLMRLGRGEKIAFRFHARDLHLVLGPTKEGKPMRFIVKLDGTPPGETTELIQLRMVQERFKDIVCASLFGKRGR